MEKTPVDLTVEQAADALDLSIWTVLRHIREDKARKKEGKPLIFPNAYLLHNSRKHGYRIPERDVLAYAQNQGESLVQQAIIIVEDAREEQRQALVRLLEEQKGRKHLALPARA